MKNKMDNFKYNVSEALELPKDVVLDLPKIIITGNIGLNISNHKGIIEYDNQVIRINSKSGIIKVTGNELEIKNILSEEILIIGNIEQVEILG